MSGDDPALRKLREQVADLEARLAGYHEELSYAIDQRDKFALKATWGIISGVSFFASIAGTNYAFTNWLKWEGWAANLTSGAVSLVVLGALLAYVEKGQEGDVRKLERLPEWRSVHWSEYE